MEKKCVFLQNNLPLPTLHVIVPLIVPCIDPITWIFGVIDPTWFTIWSVYKCFIVSSYDNNLIRVVWNLGRWKTAVDQSFYCKVYYWYYLGHMWIVQLQALAIHQKLGVIQKTILIFLVHCIFRVKIRKMHIKLIYTVVIAQGPDQIKEIIQKAF